VPEPIDAELSPAARVRPVQNGYDIGPRPAGALRAGAGLTGAYAMDRPINRRRFIGGAGLGLLHLTALPSALPAASRPIGTIDDVVAALEAIIDWSIARRDRRGYFAALYYNTTLAIRAALTGGEFLDSPRMETFAVRFFHRYLDALRRYAAGELPSRVWLGAFDAARRDDCIVLQHLAAGVNAHINLDLGVVAARMVPASELSGLRPDYDRIYEILTAAYPLIDERLDRISPLYRQFTGRVPGLAFWLVGLSLQGTREAAWRLAGEIAGLDPPGQLSVMARRDDNMARLGRTILRMGRLVEAIGEAESRDVARNVAILAYGS
jgi:hypothetical protein